MGGNSILHHDRSTFTHMGYSIRTASYSCQSGTMLLRGSCTTTQARLYILLTSTLERTRMWQTTLLTAELWQLFRRSFVCSLDPLTRIARRNKAAVDRSSTFEGCMISA